MTTTQTAAMWSMIPPELHHQFACPNWCTNSVGHWQDEEQIADQGSVDFYHQGVVYLVLDSPNWRANGQVTVQLTQMIGYDIEKKRLVDDGPALLVLGLDADIEMSADDAVTLGLAISEATGPLNLDTRLMPMYRGGLDRF